MVDRRRHAPTARHLAITSADRPRPFPHAYRGRSYKSLKDIYDADHAEPQQGGRFRWLISTCLAATVGAVAILVVIYGSADPVEGPGGLLPALRRPARVATPNATMSGPQDGGLKWAMPKSDKLQIASGAMSTRYVIHESLKKKRNGREYIEAKPYVRIVARLSTVPPNYADVIPPFNPYKLYGGAKPTATAEEEGDGRGGRPDVSVKVVELLGGILPGEDGQELDAQEVTEIVERSKSDAAPVKPEAGEAPDAMSGGIGAVAIGGGKRSEPLPPNTTALAKSSGDAEEGVVDIERREVRVVKAARGDTLKKVLMRSGADPQLATAMVEAAKTVFPDNALAAGQEVHIATVPSLTDASKMEPARFSVFTESHEHKVTLYRTPSGDFAVSATPVEEGMAVAAEASDKPQSTSLYASVYLAGLLQNVPSDIIELILRVHASDTDFRRRVKTGDAVELFFDSRDDGATEGPPGELLYTSITSGGDNAHFYRFKTPDGIVDYYDDQGNNSKKFLMRKPIRGDDVRLTSGFGFRFHPLLNERKMHTGIDWSAPPGTPILASGTGVIEEAGRKGYNGNYVRIRHANGYHTAYSHMLRFAPGVAIGAKVRQAQLIGYVGNTGLSTGPHLHFEVLINNRFVDPLSIQVPRERQLTGKQLADFQKERARIDELMRRSPVLVQSK